jgi:hypothetical protein
MADATSRSMWPACVLLAFVLTVFAGCSGNDRPKLVPVSGTVLYNGEPVEAAHVVFLSETTERPARATTDAQGRFRLTSFDPHDGAVPGKHVITVSKVVGDDAPAAAASMEDVVAAGPTETQVRYLLPERYGDPKRSGLEETVPDRGTDEITLDLTD